VPKAGEAASARMVEDGAWEAALAVETATEVPRAAKAARAAEGVGVEEERGCR